MKKLKEKKGRNENKVEGIKTKKKDIPKRKNETKWKNNGWMKGEYTEKRMMQWKWMKRK